MISVIIPVYNVETYLEKCLRSVLTNTYHDLEVICVNDGSSDGCLEILQRMQMEDPRLVIIDQMNQGVQMARNNGIKKAKGEYIAFIDSDDWVHPQYFQTLLNCMETKSADIAICGCKKFSENEEITVKYFQDIHYRRLSAKQFNKSYYARHMVWGRLFRSQNLQDIWFIPEVRMADDTLYNLSVVCELEDPIVYETDTALYYYLQRSNSIVNTRTTEKMIGFPEWCVNNRRVSNRSLIGPWAWIRLMQAIKFALSYRFDVYVLKDKKGKKRANVILRILVGDMLRDEYISTKNKIIYTVMCLSPVLYRYFRLREDPTMKVWEKMLKKQRDL